MIIVGAHPLANPSMRRYTDLLKASYERRDDFDGLVQPSSFLSRHAPVKIQKWMRYLEQIPLAFYVGWKSRTAELHIADHSDAVYIAWAPRGRAVVTCHDLIAVAAAKGEIPEHTTGWTGRLYQRLVVRGLTQASLIVSVSATTASDVLRLIGRESPVVLNPLSEGLQSGTPSVTRERNFALVVSTVGWRKRRWLAIESWLALKDASTYPIDLVIVGSPLENREVEIITAHGAENLSRITVLKGLSDEEMARLYESAILLIQMSQYEGFAWPIIEANAFGTVALCADEPILRETGSGNLFIRAEDVSRSTVADWQNILAAAENSKLRRSVQERATAFSVERFDSQLRRALELSG